MFIAFLILAIIAALILFPAILLQAGQGGGLTTQFGGGSSTDSFVGGRQAATWLHKASWYGGGGFLAICFMLQLIGSRGTAPRSLTEEELRRTQQQAAPRPLSQPPLQQQLPLQNQPAESPATPPPAPGSSQQPPAPGTQKRP